uniref:L1 transposable element RRM domain-containing protein n=1 Tax=Esox lucius TaxID=8010 RepID=A0A6Q2WZ56_ESOLU
DIIKMDTNIRGTKNTLTSPSKPPAPQKKSKPDDVVTAGAHEVDASNAAILAAIGTLQNMMQDFKAELKQNTLTIANIAKAVDFNSAEIKDCKEQCQTLHVQVKQLKEENTDLVKRAVEVEKRAVELERYKRWNLRVNGLQEGKDENTRQILSDIIGKIVPQWREKMDFILDSVHRLGQSNTNRPRQIIMQFTGRHFRDELWRVTKLHPVCKDLNIHFSEDLTKEDREARMAVWPKVEQAMKAGLKTGFRGPHAFINGQRMLYFGLNNGETKLTLALALQGQQVSPSS